MRLEVELPAESLLCLVVAKKTQFEAEYSTSGTIIRQPTLNLNYMVRNRERRDIVAQKRCDYGNLVHNQ
jgi:hypothetical protein